MFEFSGVIYKLNDSVKLFQHLNLEVRGKT